MSDDLPDETALERRRLPLMLGVCLALYGASRFDATRSFAAVLLTYGFPILAVWLGGAPLRESRYRAAVVAVGITTVVASEVVIGRSLAPHFEVLASLPATGVLQVVLVATGVGAVALQALGARRGLRNHFAPWVGMVSMLGLYFPSHAKVGKDGLDAFIAALLVSLFVGGGVGLLLGSFATRAIKPARANSKREPS